ncbi:HYD1 signature containing ADP-ribosyltransferase family protein [uncultured Microscilla sp.]|uniref:HYD1 signature containing ADP-ribosyltransferase family protein n=1 Tax=uncultured Microscilla sp. TaxID=432653 RepID=UPI00261E912F|nr:HYD1 signature containing ADP-ribosyltransferase family protein [uncultured Microscilla sp.]
MDENGNIISQEVFEKFSKEVDGALEILNKKSTAWIPKKIAERLPGALYKTYNLGPAKSGTILYHYTNKAGFDGITTKNATQLNILRPSLTTSTPNHAHFGSGYYLSTHAKNSKKLTELSTDFVGSPSETRRFTHCVAIDVSGLNVYRGVGGRSEVYLIRGTSDWDITSRIRMDLSGENIKK